MLNLHTDPATGKYTIFINASGIKVAACGRRAFYTFLAGLRLNSTKDFKIEFGSAFHKFIQLYYSGIPVELCLSAAVEYYAHYVEHADWRDTEYLISACTGWVIYDKGHNFFRPKVINDKPALEQRFAIPLYSSDLADYVLCGTIDMIAEHGLYGTVIVDHKTTSVRTIQPYLDAYEFSVQLAIYQLAAEKLEIPVAGSVINGIFMAKGKSPEFVQSGLITMSRGVITDTERYLKLLVGSIDSALTNYMQSYIETSLSAFPRNITQCEGKWGMCPFTPLCRNESYDEVADLAKSLFESKPYNPLKVHEQK